MLDNKDGSVSLYLQPTEKGMHELHVLLAGVPITGAPIASLPLVYCAT